MSRRMNTAATVRIGTMNSETLAPSGMSLPWMPIRNAQVAKYVGAVDRAAGGEDANDVEIGEGDDQREQRGDGR